MSTLKNGANKAPLPPYRGHAVRVGPYQVLAGGTMYLRPEDLEKADVLVPLTGVPEFRFGEIYQVSSATQPTGITAFAAERRSQDANRQQAIFRLRLLLALHLRTVESPDVQPSPLWQSRCRNQKIACNDRHDDFPAMLAEALNAVDAKDYDVRRAAAALGCSFSQLTRFLARTPEALELVNTHRATRGLHRLLP